MSIDQWDRRPDGNVKLCPLVGWETARFHTAGFVRLNYVESPEQLQTQPLSLQVAANAPQLREFAQALLRLADQLDQDPKGTRQ